MQKSQDKKTVFEFDSVRLFLDYVLSAEILGRGSRVKLAEVLGVQNSFISLVTTGRTKFSLEQGLKCATYLNLNDEETRYFINLIQIERAGNEDLKTYFEQEQKKILNRRAKIKNRIQVTESVSIEDQQTYYSHVNYILIHIMSVLPRYSKPNLIAAALGVSESTVKTHLKFLESRGFIQKTESGGYKIGQARIHLPVGAPGLPNHHANLRSHAIQSLGAHKNDHLHFSAVFGLNQKTYQEIREVLLKTIEETEKGLKKSSPEFVSVLNIDWYDI